ncbi:hypothetical protein MMC28_008830 [Mycoblastus sanguinarius]|nr:hypothetical protein [Mycoblastus sanguinarius]
MPANAIIEVLKFPNEVLLHLIDVVDSEDLESFALCCPRLGELADKRLKQHRRRKEYYTLAFGYLGEVDGLSALSAHPILTLRDVLSEPQLASYPTKMIIGDCSYYPEDGGLESRTEFEDAFHNVKVIVFEILRDFEAFGYLEDGKA